MTDVMGGSTSETAMDCMCIPAYIVLYLREDTLDTALIVHTHIVYTPHDFALRYRTHAWSIFYNNNNNRFYPLR